MTLKHVSDKINHFERYFHLKEFVKANIKVDVKQFGLLQKNGSHQKSRKFIYLIFKNDSFFLIKSWKC